jgi:GTPase
VQNYPEGQVVFVDTPGIHRPLHRMNVRMVDAALEAMRQVDVVGLVVDATERTGGGDRFLHGPGSEGRRPSCSSSTRWTWCRSRRSSRSSTPGAASTRSRRSCPSRRQTGENVDRLEQAIFLARLPEGEPLYPPDYLTDQPERFFVAEIVREQVLRHTHAELPFSTAVIVDRFEEPTRRG